VYVPGGKPAVKLYVNGVADENVVEQGSTVGQSATSATPSPSASTRNWWDNVSELLNITETMSPCRVAGWNGTTTHPNPTITVQQGDITKAQPVRTIETVAALARGIEGSKSRANPLAPLLNNKAIPRIMSGVLSRNITSYYEHRIIITVSHSRSQSL
jgi:hypothetical protein